MDSGSGGAVDTTASDAGSCRSTDAHAGTGGAGADRGLSVRCPPAGRRTAGRARPRRPRARPQPVAPSRRTGGRGQRKPAAPAPPHHRPRAADEQAAEALVQRRAVQAIATAAAGAGAAAAGRSPGRVAVGRRLDHHRRRGRPSVSRRRVRAEAPPAGVGQLAGAAKRVRSQRLHRAAVTAATAQRRRAQRGAGRSGARRGAQRVSRAGDEGGQRPASPPVRRRRPRASQRGGARRPDPAGGRSPGAQEAPRRRPRPPSAVSRAGSSPQRLVRRVGTDASGARDRASERVAPVGDARRSAPTTRPTTTTARPAAGEDVAAGRP